ncbi:PilW family protein [Colwellia sp. MEBiC06753]
MKVTRGFTLIEMTAVIVLLGIVSVGIGSIIRFGSQAFVDVSNRDELISSARFAVERLNRELRAALPNSVRVNENGSQQCLEFMPTLASAIYLDAPVFPELASTKVNIIRFNNDLGQVEPGVNVAIYPIYPDPLYGTSDRIYPLSSLTAIGNTWTVNFASAVRFAEDSPTKRLYFTGSPVSYCVLGSELWRFANGYSVFGGIPTNNGTLMAEYLQVGHLPFSVEPANQLRNAIIRALLKFERNNELVSFNNEVQVQNVP